MEPTYAAVMQAVAACEKTAVVGLAAPDASYLGDVDDQLRLAPLERLQRLGGPARVAAVRRVAHLAPGAIVIGDAAAALDGGPLTLPGSAPVEVCAAQRDRLALGGVDGVRLVDVPPGTRGHRDLRRDAQPLDLDGGAAVSVASALDLLRIEIARGHAMQAGALEALIEYRRRHPAGPPPRRAYTDAEASEAIDSWLTRR